MKSSALYLLFCLFLTSCVTTSPTPEDRATIYYDRATFPEKVQQDTGVLTEPILQHGRCYLLLTTPDSNTAFNYRFCTYALSEKQLHIQEWDAAALKYTHFMTINFSSLTGVDLASVRGTAPPVNQVKMLEPQRLTAFTAFIDEGGRRDTEATEKVFQTIKAQGIPPSNDDKFISRYYEPAPVTTTTIYTTPIIIPRYRHHHSHSYRRR